MPFGLCSNAMKIKWEHAPLGDEDQAARHLCPTGCPFVFVLWQCGVDHDAVLPATERSTGCLAVLSGCEPVSCGPKGEVENSYFPFPCLKLDFLRFNWSRGCIARGSYSQSCMRCLSLLASEEEEFKIVFEFHFGLVYLGEGIFPCQILVMFPPGGLNIFHNIVFQKTVLAIWKDHGM